MSSLPFIPCCGPCCFSSYTTGNILNVVISGFSSYGCHVYGPNGSSNGSIVGVNGSWNVPITITECFMNSSPIVVGTWELTSYNSDDCTGSPAFSSSGDATLFVNGGGTSAIYVYLTIQNAATAIFDCDRTLLAYFGRPFDYIFNDGSITI
jgi:hypothetical protein